MSMPFWFHKHTTHTGMDGMGDNICTALPQHTITCSVKAFAVLISLCSQIPSHPMQNTTFSRYSWSTESYAFVQSNNMMTPSVLASIRLLTNTMLFLMYLLAMKAQCEAKHSVVIESLNHHATMWECMLWCALRSVMGCASPMVCDLSLLGMSHICPCFHGCGIHTCPSFQFITNPLTTSAHILSLNSIWRPSVSGDFQTQCHLWWLMKSVFNSLMS